MRTTAKTTCLTLLAVTIATGCAHAQNATKPEKDIVDTAVEAGSFKTLAKALDAAGLTDALRGDGPLTVFAPTDKAFEKLPKGTLATLLKPANREKLQAILTYHVVPGQLQAAQVLKSKKLDTLQGGSVLISGSRPNPAVNSSRIVKTDIAATNGVIHVIDTVLIPGNIVDTAKTAGTFKTLLAAAKAAGLVEALTASDANVTVFAPTDKAFAALPKGTVEDLLKHANRKRLATILKYHVVPGRVLLGEPKATTLEGSRLDIRPTGSFRVDEATVVLANVKATNGVVHVIDRVLMPPLPEPTPVRKAMGVIELAIERGVPLFNAGNAEGCAAIYEISAKSLLDGFDKVLSDKSTKRLKSALAAIRKDHRARNQAWTLRRALDDVYAELRKQEN